MRKYTTISTSIHGHRKRVLIESSSGKRQAIDLQRFAMLGKGNVINISSGVEKKIWCQNSENKKDPILVSPGFASEGELKIGAYKVPLRFHEVISDAHLDDFKFLESFHYKTIDFQAQDHKKPLASKASGGRKAVIMCYARFGKDWFPAAYIELQMPLMMCKPRHDLFAAPFKHPDRDVSWITWNQSALKYVNTICRIARVVVHPEYRGLAITKPLLSEAKTFAKERWHIAGARPLFMEISAEMLNYIDFVSSSGFHFAGNTQGNLSRIFKDMGSMKKGKASDFKEKYQINTGIMSLQKKYHDQLEAFSQEIGATFDETLERVKTIAESDNPREEMSPIEWF
ncbi:MAG: hypothetical protein HOA60_09470, partial [Rhodospirillales bacterium]|nr:hypothetical protein [Rhodospirillales bacterium]